MAQYPCCQDENGGQRRGAVDASCQGMARAFGESKTEGEGNRTEQSRKDHVPPNNVSSTSLSSSPARRVRAWQQRPCSCTAQPPRPRCVS